ncbi:MAG: DUF1385 domain-containing protein [Bacillota bacterium]
MAQSTPSYGGQAVLEGVVMRGPTYVSLSVRKPDGDISSMTKRAPSPSQRSAFMRFPVIRGAFAFVDSFTLGIEMLIKSAEIAAPDEEKPSSMAVNLGVGLGVTLAIGLFILLPAAVTPYLLTRMGIDGRFLSSLFETLFRLVILIGYIALVFRMPEIRRVIEYHGAEHKVIWAWERNYREMLDRIRNDGWDMARSIGFLVDKGQRESRLHPRCGTSFLFIVVLCTWVVFLFVNTPSIPLRVAVRLVLLPLAAGLSYEVLKLSADKTGFFWKVIRAPGMALQSMTTREPDKGELEVAATSLMHLVEVERGVFR